MPPNDDTAQALADVPWPDQAPTDPYREALPLCCVECSNNEFVKTVITTDRGTQNALECTHCHEVYIDD
ncbi:hypothetical protein [Nonomuraea endophytica]|uniref:hypothetical protein n=1 Tax=Nonomuraea endophytica TaxID=714136 RepID=UPI0037C5F7B6